jgi:hypothetical protein
MGAAIGILNEDGAQQGVIGILNEGGIQQGAIGILGIIGVGPNKPALPSAEIASICPY